MNKALLVLVAVVAIVCFAQQKQDIPSSNQYQKPKNAAGKYCKRDLSINFSNGKKVIVVTAKAACPQAGSEENKKRGAAAEIRFAMTSIGLARMKLEGRKKTQDKVAGFRVGFAVDKIVEFVDDGTAYAPGKQQVVNEINFVHRPVGTPKMGQWSDIITSTSNAGDVTVHDVSAEGTHNDAKIKLGVTFATAEVTVTTANQTVSKTVLRPNSFKLNLILNDILYKQSNTRLAIGAILVTKRGAKERPATRRIVADEDGEDVADNTQNQSVVDVEDEEDGSAENGGFFSFKRFVFGRLNGTGIVNKYNVLVTPITISNNATDGQSFKDDAEEGFGGYITRRLFITPQGRPTQIVWDPAAGTNETPTNSANAAASVSMMVCAIVLALLSFLY